MPLSPCSASLEYGIEPSSSGFGLQNDTITYAGKPLLTLASIPLAGLHNVLNVMASLALCHAFGASLEKAARAVVSFEPPPHRCIEIANVNGVRWIDDSKATNVGATIAAIEGLSALTKGRIILIAGGDGKGANLSNLKPLLDNQVAKVIALGKDAAQFSAMFGETFRVTSMEQAVKCAAEIATTGDVVLLSPACASIDMFRNYAHRGEVFAHAVTEFIAPSGVSPGYVGAEATHL